MGDACVADTLVRNTACPAAPPGGPPAKPRSSPHSPRSPAHWPAGTSIPTRPKPSRAPTSPTRHGASWSPPPWAKGPTPPDERAAVAEVAARNDTPEQRFMRQHANRFLRFYNNRDGMVCLEGALDPDSGARLKAKVAAIANRMWRTDKQQPPSRRSVQSRTTRHRRPVRGHDPSPGVRVPAAATGPQTYIIRSSPATPEHQETDSSSVAASQPQRPAPSRARSRTERTSPRLGLRHARTSRDWRPVGRCIPAPACEFQSQCVGQRRNPPPGFRRHRTSRRRRSYNDRHRRRRGPICGSNN